MKAVLISIQPKWCELIASGKKTIEVRKTAPKFDKPFKVYIYETKDKKYDGIGVHWENGRDFIHNGGKVIGEFICDDLLAIENLKSSFRVKEDREGEGRLTNMTATASWLSALKVPSFRRGLREAYLCFLLRLQSLLLLIYLVWFYRENSERRPKEERSVIVPLRLRTPTEDHMTKKALFLRLSPKKVDSLPAKVDLSV